jgi:hypothetical protein
MKALFALPRDILTMPPLWVAWMALMILLNAIVPLFFLDTAEGAAVLATFMVAAGLMMALHRLKGFVRLLGIAHFVWLPLLGWLALNLADKSGFMRTWLIALIVVNGLSLAIDVIDVVRYLRGDREQLRKA